MFDVFEIDSTARDKLILLFNIKTINIKGKFIGLLRWEQHRNENNKYFAETNKSLATLDAASNYSLCSSEDKAMLVENCCADYAAKEALGGLNHAALSMLAAMNFIEKQKNIVSDAYSNDRKAKF